MTSPGDLPTSAAVDALHCLMILEANKDWPTEKMAVAVAIAQVHATLAVAEAVRELPAAHGEAGEA